MAALFAVAIESVCLFLGFDARTSVRSSNNFGDVAGKKSNSRRFEDYASLIFVGDHIADHGDSTKGQRPCPFADLKTFWV